MKPAPEKARHDRRARRAELIPKIADVLLERGVAQIPLRELAQRLGTSDRMLLYYFDDKADLVRCSLDEVNMRLAAGLAGAFAREKSSPADLIAAAMPLLISTAMAPHMNVWADISARGGRGEAPFEDIARSTVDLWLRWLEERLDVEPGESVKDAAAAILTIVEGARLIETFAPGATTGALSILSQGFASPPRTI
jgi:AcrR family transcriptional regulator